MKQVNYIDLGLPSGTLWADRNLGADAPEKSGDYFRFGETKSFTIDSPKYVGFEVESEKTDSFQGCIAGTEHDAATVILGEKYRMPTIGQIKELLNICKWEWTKQNDVNGMIVTGPNGNRIFLPVSGWGRRNDSELFDVDTDGLFWSSSCRPCEFFGLRGQFVYYGKNYRNIYCKVSIGRLPIRAIAQGTPLSGLLQINKLFMKELCDKLNKCLPCQGYTNKAELIVLLEENIEAYSDRQVYISDEVLILTGSDPVLIRENLFSGDVLFVPSEYPQERLGVKLYYRHEIEESTKGNYDG